MIQTITMDPALAREKHREYRAAVKARHAKEDEAICRGYRALSQGKALINLSETLKRGGLDHEFRPRLAIARADAKACWFQFTWANNERHRRAWWTTHADKWDAKRGAFNWRYVRHNIWFDSIFPQPPDGKAKTWMAMVPCIPPGLRPAARLERYHVLWEADWTFSPPADPYLLQRIDGDLWCVLAQWDLTELERAVIAGTRAMPS